MIKQAGVASLFFSALVSLGAGAHHSRTAFFHMDQTVELAGEITRVQWRHPHVRYWIQADEEFGGELWELETTGPSLLERQGINQDIVTVGTHVRVAGPPSKLTENVMEASHVLLPDGREVLLHSGGVPIWTDNTVERSVQEFDDVAIRASEATANGIFRVWSRPGFGLGGRQPLWLDSYPLTDAAQAAVAVWNPVTDIEIGCKPKGMPLLMASGWPVEFVDQGDRILLRAEEFDRERIIHLVGVTGDVSPSPLGYSIGYWEDTELVVATTGVNSLSFRSGIPLSEDVEILERFSLSPDERRLDYEITVTDPAIFTEPVTMNSNWIWRPGESIKLYNCIETPGSWTDRSTN